MTHLTLLLVTFLAGAEPSPACVQAQAALQAEPTGVSGRPLEGDEAEGPRVFVVTTAANLRSAPVADAQVRVRLGYGRPVIVRSMGCEGWQLVASRYGAGFVRADETAPALLTIPQLEAKEREASSEIEAAAWALLLAQTEPSPRRSEAAAKRMAKARASLTHEESARCETFVGACDLLVKASVRGGKRLEHDPRVGDVPIGPWWAIPSQAEAARPAVFRAAWIYASGECNSCGTESCQTTLEVELATEAAEEGTRVLAASRRPPASWFRALPTEGCAKAEAIARASRQWDVPKFAGDPTKPATPGEGACIPGPGGSVWWQQAWHHPEMAEMESDEVLRTYRIARGRVVEAGVLADIYSTSTTVFARSARPVGAWRDLGGDGREEEIRHATYGRWCAQTGCAARE